MVLRQKREENNILFIDASKEFIKSGNKNVLQASHIKKIVDTYKNKANIEKYSKLVLIEEVRENGYNLNIPRYIDSSEDTENYDIYATMFGGIPYEEIDTLKKYWDMLPDLKNKLFKETSTPYTTLNNTDIKNIILNHKSINNFIDSFNNSFADFGEYLKNILIAKSQTLHIANTEDEISKNIYNRIKDLKLLNYYDAYQYFIDEWQIIENDLEIMQTEGFNAVKQVNPNIVKKKKNNKEVEVQEGWIGHILPFNIVQETFLQDKYNKLTAKQARIEEIQEELTEIIESLPEEERESTIINDDNTAFVSKELKTKVCDLYLEITNKKASKKTLKDNINNILTNNKLDIESAEYKILKAYSLLKEDSQLKKEIKEDNKTLHEETKIYIENIDNGEAQTILYKKWIKPIINSINNMPHQETDLLINKVKYISEKYNDTLIDIGNEIVETEKEICSMIDELDACEFDLAGLHEFKKLLGDN